MSNIKVINSGNKFTHASVGKLHTFEGKQFVKDASGATSCEISFGTLPSGASVPFFHSHKENEENYIREFGIRNTIKKLNRQLEKAADSFGNITDI